MMKQSDNQPSAVVVGLCAHGLDIVKSLARKGIRVKALEANPGLPGNRTKFAETYLVNNINAAPLIDELIKSKEISQGKERQVLFLTNDNMVSQVADNWHILEPFYKLSWSESRGVIKSLLLKSNLQKYCEGAGLLYPKSWELFSANGISNILSDLKFPIIVKPVKPLSKFKASLISSSNELNKICRVFQSEMPFLIQEWIPGGVSEIMVCALYLENDKVLAHMEGRKLSSLPQGLGVTTVMEPIDDEKLYRQAVSFFKGLNITGPVSLEVKRDKTGNLWVIEPTVGRTDYWVGCCIANGVDLPYIEYCHQSGLNFLQPRKRFDTIWVDLERDPLSPRVLLHKGISLFNRRIKFSYIDFNDIGPLLAFTLSLLIRIVCALARKTKKK